MMIEYTFIDDGCKNEEEEYQKMIKNRIKDEKVNAILGINELMASFYPCYHTSVLSHFCEMIQNQLY